MIKKIKEKQRKIKMLMNILIDKEIHKKYKYFCKKNGLIMSKRIQDMMEADLEKRLIRIPEVKL